MNRPQALEPATGDRPRREAVTRELQAMLVGMPYDENGPCTAPIFYNAREATAKVFLTINSEQLDREPVRPPSPVARKPTGDLSTYGCHVTDREPIGRELPVVAFEDQKIKRRLCVPSCSLAPL